MEKYLIKYADIIEKYNSLQDSLNGSDLAELRKFILKEFQPFFELGRGLAKAYEVEGADLFKDLSDDDKNELLRPLSTRQTRMLETIFHSVDEDEAREAYWDFLDDYGRIGEKRLMSIAEICTFGVMTERMLVLVSR